MTRLILCAFAVSLACGCGQPAPPATEKPAAPPAKAAAAHAEYAGKMRDTLADIDAKIAKWEAKLPLLQADVQAKLRTRLEELRERRGDFAQLVQQINAADDAGWALLKDKTDKTCADLRSAFERTTTEFP